MLITLEKISPLRDNARGNAYGFDVRPCGYPIILHRKAGTTSGNHYHKGITQSKSPEIFYLAKGKIRLSVKDIETAEEEIYEVEENTKIEIPPKIYHTVFALTDIIFIELNTKKEDFENDTFKLV